MKITTAERPDWAGASQKWPRTVATIMLRSAILMILDNTDRIRDGVTIHGNKQVENSKRWREHKLKKFGHQIPLRYNEILMDPNKWLINGRLAKDFISGFGRRVARFPSATISRWRPVSNTIHVMVPKIRQQVIIDLARLGYAVPLGMTPKVQKLIEQVARIELRDPVQTMKYSFKITFSEGV